MKVRLIVKKTFQPPIDTPASIKWETIEVECERLYQLLGKGDDRYTTSEVIGAEQVIPPSAVSLKEKE